MSNRNSKNFNDLLSRLVSAHTALEDVGVRLHGWILTPDQHEAIYEVCRDIHHARQRLLRFSDTRAERWEAYHASRSATEEVDG
jgi:hypothetical protein